MKFCEKLQKLRKEKGYSQEQLADLLEVSRQSVSKWESGTTYPEMDKLLSLCKIFNVTLDDLTNDEVTTKKISEKRKNNFNNLVYVILDIISKSFEMFKRMNKQEKVKCITELIILFLILLIFKIPFNYINDSILNIFINFSENAYKILSSIWLFISNTTYLILFVAIFIYIYKIKFLDKYEFKEDTINNKTEEIDNNPEIISTRAKDSQKHSFILFDILGKLFNIFLKLCVFCILFPLIFLFIFGVICLTLALIIQFVGIHYIGIFVLLLGALGALEVLIELLFKFILSSNLNVKRLFIVFLSSITLVGVGFGITTYEVSSTNYIDLLPKNLSLNTYEYIFSMNNDIILYDLNDIKYVVNDNLTNDLKVSVSYYEDYLTVNVDLYNNYLGVHKSISWDKTLNYFELLKNDLKDKIIYNYNLLNNVDIVVETSQKNIDKLKENVENARAKEEEEYNKYKYYEEKIAELEDKLIKNENELLNKNQQIEDLQEKINNISGLIQ